MTREQIEIIQSVADILNAVVNQMRTERHARVRDEFQIEAALKDATGKLHEIITDAHREQAHD